MADIDILSFPVAPGLGGNEDVPIVQGGVNKRTTVQVLANLAIVPSAVTWKQQCAAATVEALPSNSYDNGFGGVGATLTATANGALEVDGYSPILDDRILVKNEATTANNGIYFVSQVGTGSLPWILTRAIDFDNIDNIQAGDACQITDGSTLASTFWIEVTVPTSIGSSPIVFAQLFLQYTAGNGIEINGASIAIDPAVVATLTGSQTLLNKTLSAPVITGLSANAILGTDGSGTVEAATTTGTGAVVLADSPTLVTPYLGVPSFIDLTNAVNLPPGSLPDGAIGLPIVGNGTGTPATFQQVPISTGVGGLGTGVSAFLATPSSANLATAVTDETGSGPLVFATSPTLVSPALGTPTSIVLTNGTGLPISSGVSGLGTGVATFLATPSSANLAAALTDETGTGSAVFANSPALTGTPTAPTASVGTNTTQIATTAFVLANGGGANVADRTALAALPTSKAVAWLEEAGRQGAFQWNSANLSAEVTADTQQGIYVAPSSDPTGASGAWVRHYFGGLYPQWFGAIPDNSTDCGPGLRAACDFINSTSGGEMLLGSGTYLVKTLGANNRMLTPYANMTICGMGDESIIKLADGVSTTQFFGIYNGVSTSASTDCSNFCCRNFTIDYNGQNNQITSYTAGIYIAVGDNVIIDGVKTLNFPGSQPLVVGATYASNGTTILTTPTANRPQITNCRFQNVGATVDANITDSSDIYVVCNDGVVAGNTFINTTQDTLGTAIELHGSGSCYGNTMYQKGKMFNVGGYPNSDWIISANKGRECCNFATLYDNVGTGVYFGLTALFDGNELVTSQLPSSGNAALINASTNISGSGFALAIVVRNSIFDFTGTAGTSVLPVLMIGQGNFYDFSGNTVQGYPAEVVVIDQATGIKASGRTSLLFNDNKILNCCATSTAGHTTVVLLNEATDLLGSFIANANYFRNDGGNMATCFAGTAIPPSYIVTNTAVNGVATLGPSTTAAFTPALTASTTNPTLGNSTLTGEYEIDGDYCIYRGKLTVGSTFSAGSGTYMWSLPRVPKTMLNTCFGQGLILSTAAYLAGQSIISPGSSVMEMHGFVTSSGAFSLVQSASPTTWATGNTIEWEIRYRIK